METEQINKTKKNRSSSYPFIDLEEAIELMDKLTKTSGKGPYSREVASIGIGHAKVSGTSAMKIATLVHFGLLSRTGNVYSRTSLTDRILLYTSENDKQNAIRESVMTPKLYNALITRYSNESLPTLLENILIREYGINANVSKEVQKKFITSLIFAGLLVNGVLISQNNSVAENETLIQSQNNTGFVGQSQNIKNEIERDLGENSVTLPSGIKITFPDSLKYQAYIGSFSEEIKALNTKATLLTEETKTEIAS